MLLLSNNPRGLQGPTGSHLKDITVDVGHGNQKVNLSSGYCAAVAKI